MPIQEGGQFSPDRRIVSPGVFTREIDQSGVAAGISNIGGAIVGPFAKGPAFSPMLFTNATILQNTFGVPDGTYYAPYTAAEYIQEQGTVTVVRVGGLTGYQQKYPFAIWAVKGQYNRTASFGALNSGSSYIYFYGSASNNYSESISFIGADSSYSSSYSQSYSGTITQSFSSSYTSSVFTVHSSSLTVKFNSTAADDVLLDPNSPSGSLLYSGQTITFGQQALDTPPYTFAQSTIYASSSLTLQSSYTTQSDASHSITYLNYGFDSSSFSSSIAAGTFQATLVNSSPSAFPSAPTSFNLVDFVNATMSVNLGTCGFPIINLIGVVTGGFGNYVSFTSNGMPSFDPCILPDGAWSSSAAQDVRLLTVLADTQAGGIENLIAPGFYGSSLTLTNPIANWPTEDNINDIPVDFSLTLKNSNSSTPYGVYQFSLDNSDPHYITNVFGNNPRAGDPTKQIVGQKIEAAYTYVIYEDAIAEVVDNKTKWFIVGAALPSASFAGEPLDFTDAFSRNLTEGDSQFSITNATTPWILSQKIAPWQSGSTVPTRFELFQVATLNDGTSTNTEYKIEISNVKLAGTVAGTEWGSFTLTIRDFSDTDKRVSILEQFTNLTLDPNDSNFIARRIGDRYNFINNTGKVIEFGEYSNNSKYIRIVMTQNNYPMSAIPYGFEAFITPTNGSMGFWTPTMKYTKASVYGLAPGKYPSGITFDDAPTGADSELFGLYPTSSFGVGASEDNRQYLAPIPSFNIAGASYDSIGRNIVFGLDDDYEQYGVGTGSFLEGNNIIPTVFDVANESTYVKMRKFVVGFQGGFDGQSPSIPIELGGNISPGNTQGLDCTNVTSAGSVAYAQAIAALGNADQYDINLIAVPGIIHQHHPYVTNLIVDMCENRGDVFYILDLYSDGGNPTNSQIDQVVSYASEYDTNYAGAYYPWIKILDTFNNIIVTVPPSVVLPSVYASNDKIAAEWFAPAGLNRGGIPIATQVTDRTTHEERDTLYEGKVNPIASFPGTGIVVWGQKTLQNNNSALNRINVRRLLINLKKFFASTSKYLVFEQNVASTRNKFLSIVNPYMESVQQRSGLYAFYVQMDDSNNTPDIIDQNILYGQIYLKPVKSAEFIILDFNILPRAQFPNA